MEINNKLKDIGSTFQKLLEKNTKNFPSGICYLSAFCIANYFKRIGIKSKIIIGELAMINIKDKYVIYGEKLKLKKSINVGDYHAWCEIDIDEVSYIVDPSIKYNIIFLKKNYNFKASKKITDTIVTNKKNTYNWKFIENEKLRPFYEHFILKIPKSFTEELITQLQKNHPRIN